MYVAIKVDGKQGTGLMLMWDQNNIVHTDEYSLILLYCVHSTHSLPPSLLSFLSLSLLQAHIMGIMNELYCPPNANIHR